MGGVTVRSEKGISYPQVSRNGPKSWIRPGLPEKTERGPARKGESDRENVNKGRRSSEKMGNPISSGLSHDRSAADSSGAS
jgi:hypothetical protein